MAIPRKPLPKTSVREDMLSSNSYHSDFSFGDDEAMTELVPFVQTQVHTNEVGDHQKFLGAESASDHRVTIQNSENSNSPWLREPQVLEISRWQLWGKVGINLFMILVPWPFFIFAGVLTAVHSKVVEPRKFEMLENSAKTCATVFQLVFAAVVGRTMMKIASWKLEKGVRLETLEQFTGSRTVFSSIKTQFALGSYNILGLALIIMWLTSPLGAQAPLRILSIGTRPNISSAEVQYMSTRAQSSFQGEDTDNAFLALLNGMWFSCLVAPNSVKISNLDLWGNLKIPYLSSTGANWTDVVQGLDASDYSSMLGIPLFDVPLGNTTFYIESTYIQLNCNTVYTLPEGPKIQLKAIGASNGTFQGTNWNGNTSWSLGMDYFAGEEYLWDVPANLPNTTAGVNPGTLLYQDDPSYSINTGNTSAFASCGTSQQYIESKVACNKTISLQNCSVVSQRPSQLPHPDSLVTWLSFGAIFNTLSQQLPTLSGSAELHINSQDMAQRYIFNPDTGYVMGIGNSVIGNPVSSVGLVSPDLFGRRLGQLLNTYMTGSISPLIMNGDGNISDAYLLNPASPRVPPYNPILATNATVSNLHEVYLCNWAWLIVLVAAVAVMLFAALLGAYYDLRTKTPEILGCCSVLTRDSQYIDVPCGGSLLDGFERARLLKNVELRFGDVGTEGVVREKNVKGKNLGYLAVANIDIVGGVVPGKKYL